ncbi:MAG: CotH kinase family protein [Planctomycetota bacterium]|jgi:hypothetical protein
MRPAFTSLIVLSLLSGAFAQQKDFYDIDTLQSVSFVFKQANWKTQLAANHASKTYIRCDVTINGVLFKDAGVRYRGNSSYSKLPTGSEKQPYKVKLDAFVAGQNYQGYATLNFSNNFMDPTWVRETVGYYVFRQLISAPKSNYLTLRINNVDYGPFVNTQQMNKAFLREWFPSDDGNRYKPLENFKQQANLAYLGPTSAPYQQTYEIKNENASSPWTDLIAVTNALNNSGTSIQTALPKLLDVDNALRMNAGDVTMLRLDAYVGSVCHNYLLYHDLVHGRFQFMPWDMNNSFGGFPDGAKSLTGLTSVSLYYRSTTSGPKAVPRPLQSKLLAVPAWRSRYIAHCREISRWLDWTTLKPVIDRFQGVVAKAAANDPKRLYPHSHFTSNLTSSSVVTQFKLTVYGIKPVVDGRKAYLATLPEFKDPINTISNLTLTPANPTAASRLQFTVRVVPPTNLSVDKVKLHWRLQGVYAAQQMFDDGLNGDGKANDSVFGVSLPPQAAGNHLEYYVESTVQTGKAWNMNFLPAHASFKPRTVYIDHKRGGPALRINEFMARNATTVKDEANDFDDWVEIYNSTNASINVSGMYLSDDPRNPKKWQFPANQSIPAQGTLLVWCDREANEGPLHASFKLDGDGEWVGLFDTDGTTLIDDFGFGAQQTDISTGRLFDGGAPWVTLLAPTPKQPNDLVGGCGQRGYSALDPTNHRMSLAAAGTLKLNSTLRLQMTGGPRSGVALLFLAAKPDHLAVLLPGVTVLVQPPLAGPWPLSTKADGSFDVGVAIPNDSRLVSVRFYAQLAGVDALGLSLSNAVELAACQ